jgi:demethylmenaquinone methyltransferase/2-methoxy-6-polyprenyl-1,4-benzoquinol methylase
VVPERIERERVREMFSDIAPTYDLLNRLLSFGIDRIWRRAAIGLLLDGLAWGSPARLLDLATGTGDVALAVRRRLGGERDVEITGADLAFPMLAIGRRKAQEKGAGIGFLQADALSLPFEDATFDGAIIAFGIRNLEDRAAGLREMCRVLRPGGRLVVLEFGTPDGLFGLIYRIYFGWVLPVAGRLVSGHKTAYSYLPSTVSDFPPPDVMCHMFHEAGLTGARSRPMTGGIVNVYSAERAP